MKGIVNVDEMSTKELLQRYVELNTVAKEVDEGASLTANPFTVSYIDDYGFEIEKKTANGHVGKYVFRPDKMEFYVESDGDRTDYLTYPGYESVTSRFENDGVRNGRLPHVTNQNIDGAPMRRSYVVQRGMNLADFVTLFKNNLITFRNPELYMSEISNYGRSALTKYTGFPICDLLHLNLDFLLWIFENTSIRTNHRLDSSFLFLAFQFYVHYGEELAKYFVLSFNKSSISVSSCYNDSDGYENPMLFKLIKDPRRTIDYMLFETYNQGIRDFNVLRYTNYLNVISTVPTLGQKMRLSSFPENSVSAFVEVDKATRTKNFMPDLRDDVDGFEDSCFVDADIPEYIVIPFDINKWPEKINVIPDGRLLIDKKTETVYAIIGPGFMIPVKEMDDRLKAFAHKYLYSCK